MPANQTPNNNDDPNTRHLQKQSKLGPKDVQYMQDAAEKIAATFPDNHGFILFVAPVGQGGHMRYISSLHREDAINLLKEWLIRCSGEEEWLNHI